MCWALTFKVSTFAIYSIQYYLCTVHCIVEGLTPRAFHLQLENQVPSRRESNSCPPEPVFLIRLRSARNDSQPDGPVWQPFLSYWLARLHRLAESIPKNLFLGFINVYKFGLLKSRRSAVFSTKLPTLPCWYSTWSLDYRSVIFHSVVQVSQPESVGRVLCCNSY